MSVRHLIKRLPPSPFSRKSTLSTLQPVTQTDPYSLMTHDPIQICSDLWIRTFSDPSQKPFPNLTGFLSKFDLWVLSYQRCFAHFTGSFPPRTAIQSPILYDLLSLRNAVLHGSFRWNHKASPFLRGPNEPARPDVISSSKLRSFIDSPDPCFQDRVVQEVLLLILEPIFEPRFSKKSHGFRPGRNAHSVIRTVRSNFAGYLWFMRGDLSEILDNVSREVVMGCIEKAVKDRKVLGLLRSALGTSGVRPPEPEVIECPFRRKKKKRVYSGKKKVLKENEPRPDPYWLRSFFSFAPEEASKVPNYGNCGILSPLIANICLNELDHAMERKIIEFFKPSKLDSIWKHSITDSCHNPEWPEFVPSSGKQKTRKMDYIRYGGYFLIGIRGPRDDAVGMRKILIEYCDMTFGLRLDNSKIEIEHVARGIQFLDHIISRRVIYPTLRYTMTGGDVVSQKGVGTLLSVTASLNQTIRKFRELQIVKGDMDPEPLPCTPMLYSSQSHTNSQMNKLLETMADWYRYADNRKKVVGFCAYVIRSSLAKLYAARYRLKSRAKVYKIASRDLSRPLRDSSNNSAPEYSDLLRMGLVDTISGVQFSRMDSIPSCDYTPLPRNWVPEHERVLCEYVKLQDPKFFCELHRSVKTQGLTTPQEEISEIVWDYKTLSARSGRSNGQKEFGTKLIDDKFELQNQLALNSYC